MYVCGAHLAQILMQGEVFQVEGLRDGGVVHQLEEVVQMHRRGRRPV